MAVAVSLYWWSLAKLTPEQVTALKENLATLGFVDWQVE